MELENLEMDLEDTFVLGNGNRKFPRNSASFSTKSTHLERPRHALPGAGRLPNSSLRPHLAASAM